MGLKLGIVGSSVISRRQAEHAWVLIEGLILAWEPDEIWSGGATGIDSVAEAIGNACGYWEEIWPGTTTEGKKLVIERPDVKAWDPVGRRGYKARNIAIVHGVDRLVRIAKKDNQETYGSGWTADYAEERLGPNGVFRFYL